MTLVQSPNIEEQCAYISQHAPLLFSRIESLNLGFPSKELIVELLKFLNVAAEHPSLTPSKVVDEAWHQMILFTRFYQKFCQHYYQRFIHHQPGGDTEQNVLQYQNTIKIIKDKYGVAPKHIWPHGQCIDATCGLCEKG